jgi:hypothetical protein
VRPQTRCALRGDISIAYHVRGEEARYTAFKIPGAKVKMFPGVDHVPVGRALVAGSRITFAEHGEHALGGLPDRLRLFAVDSA